MKILIAGLGSIGRRHLRNLSSLGKKDIFLFRTHQSTLDDEDLQGLQTETDIKQAFSHKPDAVVIANPTSLHVPIAIFAAKTNAHIFLEKPVSHSIESLVPFEEALKSSTSLVLVGYQFRFNQGLKSIKRMIENNELGRPLSFDCRWGEYLPDWHPWEDYRQSYAANGEMGGGVVLTLSHPLDYLRWIFGEVRELYSVTGSFSDLEIKCEDSADVLLTFTSGLVGHLHLDYYRQPKRHDLLITCSQGTICWDYSSSGITIEKADGEKIVVNGGESNDRNQMYLDEMIHFMDICTNKIKPVCSYADGKKALEIAWGILQSGKFHNRVILE